MSSRPLAALDQAAQWFGEGLEVGLATVVDTWGSAPCPVGSQLAVISTEQFSGSVSGGCVEAAVIEQALACIAGAAPDIHEYGVSDQRAWAVGLACGGRLAVLVDVLTGAARRQLFARLLAERAARRRQALVVDLGSDTRCLVAEAGRIDGDEIDARLIAGAQQALAAQRSRLLDAPHQRVFVQVLVPPPRLLVVGAVHIAQALVRMAALDDWEITVIDPRPAFASAERFSGFTVVSMWPDEAFARLAPDRDTAVVALSHDPKIDDPALRRALASPAFYVGALGSRRSHQRRIERLLASGVDERSLERIHAPIGLDLGARTPVEIATAIMAELVTCRRGRA